MTVGAQVRFLIPGTDVPMTLQPLAMLLIGMTLPVPAAAAGLGLYLLAGGVGAPMFATDGGLWGTTTGYLFGFLAGSVVVAMIGRRSHAWMRLFIAGLAGMTVVLVMGVAWRTMIFGGNMGLAFATGLVPFVPKAVVECALAAAMARRWNAGSGKVDRLPRG